MSTAAAVFVVLLDDADGIDINVTAVTVATTAPPASVLLGYRDTDEGYTVVIVDNAGNVTFLLDECRVRNVEWSINEPGSATLTMNVNSPMLLQAIANFGLGVGRELQIWRNGHMIKWGVVVAHDTDSETFTMTLAGLEFYPSRLHVGRADRVNHLVNPEFESGLTGWTNVGASPVPTTTRRVLGTQSMRLRSTAEEQDHYIWQQFALTAPSIGLYVTVAGHFFLEAAGYLGPAFEVRGLYISRIGAGAELLEEQYVAINDDTPRDEWVREETGIHIPPNASETIEVRLYSPGGTIYWDALSATVMESLSFPENDQSYIAYLLMEHAQDPAYDKPALNLTFDTAPTGVRRTRHYQFAEHANIKSSLDEFTELSDGFDYAIISPTPSSRIFTTYHPRRKRDMREQIVLFPGADPMYNVTSFELSRDGRSAANSVVVLGPGDGPDREEGAAVSSGEFGDAVFESVVTAPLEARIDALDSLAAYHLGMERHAYSLTVTLETADLINELELGDLISVYLPSSVPGVPTNEWRVVDIALDGETDALTITGNVDG